MENIIKKLLSPHKNKKLVLSVSGGVDSTVLLDILIKLKFDLVLVNFNHQQRPEALDEAKYLKNLCLKEDIPFEYFLLDIKNDLNFQSEASRQRKEHLILVAKKYNTDVILTAHHLNDLAETVLLKLSRGSNILGYAGMQQVYFKYGMFFIKPLLFISKQEIENYAESNKVKYFTDSSNTSLTYTRNKIRHNVIPYLIKDNPAFLNKIIDYNKALSNAFNFIRNETIKFLNGSYSFLINEFLSFDESLKEDIIAYLLEEHDLLITTNKIKMIINYLATSLPNATLDLGKDILFIKEYNKAYIQEKTISKPFIQELIFNEENILPNGYVIIINNKTNTNNNNSHILCYNNIVEPLFARTRKPGDVLYFPFGHKKLKDFYIDKKVPLTKRDKDVLIVDSSGTILSVIGRYTNNNPNLKDKITLMYRRN